MEAFFEAIKSLGKFEPGKFDGKPRKVTWDMSIKISRPTKVHKDKQVIL